MSKIFNYHFMTRYTKRVFHKILISVLFVFTFNNGMAQGGQSSEPMGPSFWDRVYFGGGLGLQFGDNTVIQIAPIVGYKVTEKFHLGVGGTYIYLHQAADPYYGFPEYTTNIYGGSLFTKYFLFDEVFAYGEYGIINKEVYANPFSYELKRKNIQSLLVGGGYRQMVGQSVGIELLILYDVIDDPDSPYTNPILRLGIVAGF